MLCDTCLKGSVANKKENGYYCLARGGNRIFGETLKNFLNRCKIKGKIICNEYEPRQTARKISC